jgi:DNA topoisomerase IB
MNEDSHNPSFFTWKLTDLASWACWAHAKLKQQADTIEQLRLDNKDLSKLLREQIKDSVSVLDYRPHTGGFDASKTNASPMVSETRRQANAQ